MQSVGQLMKELGFNEKASFDAKKAFLKHLFKQAHIKQLRRQIKPQGDQLKTDQEPVQLSLFDQDCA